MKPPGTNDESPTSNRMCLSVSRMEESFTQGLEEPMLTHRATGCPRKAAGRTPVEWRQCLNESAIRCEQGVRHSSGY